MSDSWGSVNYQMQIVTKLPNENIQNYQLEILILSGGCKLPNANCDQITKWKYPKLPTSNVLGGVNTKCRLWPTTKWKYPKLPTRIDRFWEGWGVNYQCKLWQTTKWKYPNYQLEMFESGGEITKCKLSPNYQMKISKNYQLEMFDSDGGPGKLPNANCDQTTK